MSYATQKSKLIRQSGVITIVVIVFRVKIDKILKKKKMIIYYNLLFYDVFQRRSSSYCKKNIHQERL